MNEIPAQTGGSQTGSQERAVQCSTALLLIDVINHLDFPDNEQMVEDALTAAGRIRLLKRRALASGVPVIYVNDNFGHWRSDFREILQIVADRTAQGKKLVESMSPEDDDYFVLKPRHSGFHNTTLETLLRYLGTKRLILSGFSTHVCVLMTASDAYMLEYELFVPGDCSAAPSPEHHAKALTYMEEVFHVDTTDSRDLELQC